MRSWRGTSGAGRARSTSSAAGALRSPWSRSRRASARPTAHLWRRSTRTSSGRWRAPWPSIARPAAGEARSASAWSRSASTWSTTSSPELIQGEPVLRHAARVLLLDGVGRVLLLKWRLEDGGHPLITPGCGLGAAQGHPEPEPREPAAEGGLRDLPRGPCVWPREAGLHCDGPAYRQPDT